MHKVLMDHQGLVFGVHGENPSTISVPPYCVAWEYVDMNFLCFSCTAL